MTEYYKHYKGWGCQVICEAVDDFTGIRRTIYRAMNDGKIYSSETSDFEVDFEWMRSEKDYSVKEKLGEVLNILRGDNV